MVEFARVAETRPLVKYDSPRAREVALTNRRTAVARLRGMIVGEAIDYIRASHDPAVVRSGRAISFSDESLLAAAACAPARGSMYEDRQPEHDRQADRHVDERQ